MSRHQVGSIELDGKTRGRIRILRKGTGIGEDLAALLHSAHDQPCRIAIRNRRAQIQDGIQCNDRPGIGGYGTVGEREAPVLAERAVRREVVSYIETSLFQISLGTYRGAARSTKIVALIGCWYRTAGQRKMPGAGSDAALDGDDPLAVG